MLFLDRLKIWMLVSGELFLNDLMKSYMVTLICLSIEVMMIGCRLVEVDWYWLLLMSIVSFFLFLVALKMFWSEFLVVVKMMFVFVSYILFVVLVFVVGLLKFL